MSEGISLPLNERITGTACSMQGKLIETLNEWCKEQEILEKRRESVSSGMEN